MATFTSHPSRTNARAAQLEKYMADHVLTPDRHFVCPSFDQCRRSAVYTQAGRPRAGGREFWRGQMSHVGDHYDLEIEGAAFRTVFIGMEMGRRDELVTLPERKLQQDVAIFDQTFRTRKPHMRGTTSALRVLFGAGLGSDAAGEWLDVGADESAHLMDCYSLLNMRLCSAVRAGTTDSAATAVMDRNCLPHLAASLRILEPTVCVLQGSGVGPAIAPALTKVQPVANTAKLPLIEATVGGIRTLIASFPHPSQKGPHSHKRWGLTDRDPYLVDVVAPTLELAQRIILGGSGSSA